jgi:general secretion pathway protein I
MTIVFKAFTIQRRQKGFTLLEILVAFTILAMALGVLMQIFSRGVNGAILSDRYARASTLAESKLASTGIEEPLKEGVSNGKFDGKSDEDFTWTLSVRPYEDASLEPLPGGVAPIMSVQLFEVELSVIFTTDDQRERRVVLTALQLAPKT